MNYMNDAIELRQAIKEDCDFLYGLHCSAMRGYVEAIWGWDAAWQQRHFEQNFKPEVNQIIMLHGQDIGLVSVQQTGNELFISNVQILSEHQNKGIGSFIISKVIEQAQQQGRPVTLQVLKVNPARRLYERLDFVV